MQEDVQEAPSNKLRSDDGHSDDIDDDDDDYEEDQLFEDDDDDMFDMHTNILQMD